MQGLPGTAESYWMDTAAASAKLTALHTLVYARLRGEGGGVGGD